MKKFIKTWSYRFDATFIPCVVVYAIMAIINMQCIFQAKQSDFISMGEWFTKNHLEFVFLGAFLAIVMVHVMFLQRYYLFRPVQRRLMLLPQSRVILYLSELLTISITLIAVSVIQGLFWTLAVFHFYGSLDMSILLPTVYESIIIFQLYGNGLNTLVIYGYFFCVAGLIILFICGGRKQFSIPVRIAILLAICVLTLYRNFIDDRFYAYSFNVFLIYVFIYNPYRLYKDNKAGV